MPLANLWKCHDLSLKHLRPLYYCNHTELWTAFIIYSLIVLYLVDGLYQTLFYLVQKHVRLSLLTIIGKTINNKFVCSISYILTHINIYQKKQEQKLPRSPLYASLLTSFDRPTYVQLLRGLKKLLWWSQKNRFMSTFRRWVTTGLNTKDQEKLVRHFEMSF